VEIEEAFTRYFTDLFKGGDNLDVASCVNALDSKVTEDMNNQLLTEITLEEIFTALQQMPPLKAPGPDGFSSCFYQQHWVTVQAEVCYVVKHFFQYWIAGL
jgi:hypothetical protein